MVGTFAAALVLLLAGMVFVNSDSAAPNPSTPESPAIISVEADSIAEELERRADEDPDTLITALNSWLEPYDDYEDDGALDEYDLMLDELEMALDATTDVDTLMYDLSDEEWDTFDSLLAEYAYELAG